jgi:hypothetical protein
VFREFGEENKFAKITYKSERPKCLTAPQNSGNIAVTVDIVTTEPILDL